MQSRPSTRDWAEAGSHLEKIGEKQGGKPVSVAGRSRVTAVPAGNTGFVVPKTTFQYFRSPQVDRDVFFRPLCALPSRIVRRMAESPRAEELPLVVVGSVNADLYVEIDRLPVKGETIAARGAQTVAGGKGANQAACAARLAYPTFLIAQVGKDSYAELVKEAVGEAGVKLDHVATVGGPTGHAIVMLQPGGRNSIIIVGGANMAWGKAEGASGRLPAAAQQLIRRAGALLLQREVPDSVNIEAAKIARGASVPVVMDAGGFDEPLPQDLLKAITVLSPNETELSRITGLPCDTLEQVLVAAAKIQEVGVKQVLVKRGEHGSVLVTQDGHFFIQPAITAPEVVDTTGAGDAFTAAYAVALLEGQSVVDALKFASATGSLCVRVKGTLPSMPDRKAVDGLLETYNPPPAVLE